MNFKIDCTFPFNYKGVWYDTCISQDIPYYWCSIDQVFQNKYAFCEQPCPKIARSLVKNYPGSVHSSCLPPNPAAIPLIPSQNEMQVILNSHNYVRSVVNPPASDMKALAWDDNLARIAQRWAEYCSFGHDCQGCRSLPNNRGLMIGQNAYAIYGSSYDSSFWANSINAFLTEAKYFVYGYGSTTGIALYIKILYLLLVRTELHS